MNSQKLKAYKIKIWRVELEDVCVVADKEKAQDRAYLQMKRAGIDEQDGVKVEITEEDTCEDCGNEVGSENLEVYEDMLLCPDCKDYHKEDKDAEFGYPIVD